MLGPAARHARGVRHIRHAFANVGSWTNIQNTLDGNKRGQDAKKTLLPSPALTDLEDLAASISWQPIYWCPGPIGKGPSIEMLRIVYGTGWTHARTHAK